MITIECTACGESLKTIIVARAIAFHSKHLHKDPARPFGVATWPAVRFEGADDKASEVEEFARRRTEREG